MPEIRGFSAYARYFPKVRRALQDEEYDVIHANFGLTAPFASTQFSLPDVLTLWRSDVRRFDGFVTKLCAWRANALLGRNEEMRDLFGKDGYIVPNDVDLDRSCPIEQRVAHRHVRWDFEGTYVLFPYSPDCQQKNYLLAKTVVEETQQRLNYPIELKTLSGVPHDVVVYYLNAADAVLLTPRFEGSRHIDEEAMACNTPVVSTMVGDTKERLANVSIVGMGSDEQELIDILSEALNADRQLNERKRVESVSWGSIGEKLKHIYRSVIDGF